MHPQEILGMIKEAASMCTFKEHKRQSRRNRCTLCGLPPSSQIVPMLNALQEEKCGWVEFVQSRVELERVGCMLKRGREVCKGKGA